MLTLIILGLLRTVKRVLKLSLHLLCKVPKNTAGQVSNVKFGVATSPVKLCRAKISALIVKIQDHKKTLYYNILPIKILKFRHVSTLSCAPP